MDASAAGAVGFGLLPRTAFGLNLAFRYKPVRFFSLMMSGTFFFPNSSKSDGTAGDLIISRLTYVTLWPCPLDVDWAIGELLGCVGLEIGQQVIEGLVNNDDRSPESQTWFAVALALEQRVDLGEHAFVFVRGEAAAPIQRRAYAFVDEDGQQLDEFRSEVVSARALLGVGLHMAR